MNRPRLEDNWILYVDANDKEWAEPSQDGCPMCMAQFPHRHSILEDGTFGAILERVDVPMRDKIASLGIEFSTETERE